MKPRPHPSGIDDPVIRKQMRLRALERGDRIDAARYAELEGRPRINAKTTPGRTTKAVTLLSSEEYERCLARATSLNLSYSEWSRTLLLRDLETVQ